MKLSRELAKQAVITKCRVKYQCGAKPCLFKKSRGFPCQNKICVNL